MLLKSMDTLDQSSCYLRLLKKKKTVFFTLHITIIYSLSKERILLKNLISRGFLTEKISTLMHGKNVLEDCNLL